MKIRHKHQDADLSIYYFIRPGLLWVGLFLVVFHLPLNSQAHQLNKPIVEKDTAEYFPSQRFEGGAVAFYEFLLDNLTFPAAALRAGRMGTSIIILSIKKEGKLDHIEIINSIHRSIDSDLVSLMKQTNNMWLPAKDKDAPEELLLFIPVTYVINDYSFLQNFEKPYFLGRAMVIKGQNEDMEVNKDQYYAKQANTYYQDKDYKEAVKYLDELIRRNPYNKELFIMRGNANLQMGEKEKACLDFQHIKNFLRQPLPAVINQLCP